MIRATIEVSRPLTRKFWPLVEEDVAGHPGLKKAICTLSQFLVHGPIPLQAVIVEFGLPADLVVRQLVRPVLQRIGDLVYAVRTVGVLRPPFWLNPPGRKPCE